MSNTRIYFCPSCGRRLVITDNKIIVKLRCEYCRQPFILLKELSDEEESKVLEKKDDKIILKTISNTKGDI